MCRVCCMHPTLEQRSGALAALKPGTGRPATSNFCQAHFSSNSRSVRSASNDRLSSDPEHSPLPDDLRQKYTHRRQLRTIVQHSNHGDRVDRPERARFPEAAARFPEHQEAGRQDQESWKGWQEMGEGRRSRLQDPQDRH